MSTLFISDLHLDPSRPAVTQALLDFFSNEASQADALYILGDFFEAWIGDDDDTELNQVIIKALKSLTDAGVKTYVMPGNRDFLIGQQFAEQSGCQLLPDPSVVNLYGKSVLLVHGDSLCTGDEQYMQFRAQVRSPQWQQVILSKTLDERRAIAQQLREASGSASSNKADDIMDVTPAAVTESLQQHGVDLMIHGHTHRPAIHALDKGKRIVLGDWLDYGWVLKYQPNGEYQLDKFEIKP